MRLSTLGVSLGALLFLACEPIAVGSFSAPARSTRKVPKPPPPSLRVHDASGSSGPFSLTTLDQLVIDSAYVTTPGQHEQRVDVVDPNGLLYGALKLAVAAGPGGAVTATQLLEVAGTTIEMYHMVGEWHLTLSVDGGQPLASATVVLCD